MEMRGAGVITEDRGAPAWRLEQRSRREEQRGSQSDGMGDVTSGLPVPSSSLMSHPCAQAAMRLARAGNPSLPKLCLFFSSRASFHLKLSPAPASHWPAMSTGTCVERGACGCRVRTLLKAAAWTSVCLSQLCHRAFFGTHGLYAGTGIFCPLTIGIKT